MSDSLLMVPEFSISPSDIFPNIDASSAVLRIVQSVFAEVDECNSVILSSSFLKERLFFMSGCRVISAEVEALLSCWVPQRTFKRFHV